MKKAIGSILVTVIFVFTATLCHAGVYHDNVLSGSLFRKDVNHGYVKKLAAASEGIYSFVKKIYEPSKMFNDSRRSLDIYNIKVLRINQSFSNSSDVEDQFISGLGENDYDRKIYADYCSAKEGSLNYWDNRIDQLGYRFYVCELQGAPESFQVIKTSDLGTTKPSVSHWFGYGDGEKFQSIAAQTFRYIDSSGKLVFSYLGGGRFWVKLEYVNTTNRSVAMDLSKYRLMQNGAEYDGEFTRKKTGTYFGQDSGYIKLNPRQSIRGESIITVRGFNYDGKTLVIMIDSLKYEGFIKKLDYETFKKKLF